MLPERPGMEVSLAAARHRTMVRSNIGVSLDMGA